jgi:hypothetical protein
MSFERFGAYTKVWAPIFLDWAIFADGWGVTVDIEGLVDFAEQWLKSGSNYVISDIAPGSGGDGITNGVDFAGLADNWLAGDKGN